MRSIVTCRVFFPLTLLATLSMIGSEAEGRGGRGGGAGRASGGRAGSFSRPGSGGSRSTRAVSNQKNRADQLGSSQLGSSQLGSGQLGGQTAGALSSRAGGLSSGLTNKSQLQGMLGQPSGQLGGKHSGRNGQHPQNVKNKATNFQHGSQPFTASWYAQHPNAWQATHPHAGVAAVVTTATVAAWVGTAYAAPASSGESSTTIIVEATPEEVASASSAPVVVATDVAPAQPTPAETWFPVGIYQLATHKDAPALLMLQLVVDHQGTLRGVYYDSITDTSHNIVGTLNPSTQMAQWHLESGSQVTFQASLQELTQPAGTLQVHIPAGPQNWLLARVESQP